MKRLIFIIMLVVLLAPIGLPLGQAQTQGLRRVGPVNPKSGFPLWYEDKTGLRLTLCDNPFNCFAEFEPTLPLQFPFDPARNPANDNFADEVFFYAAEALLLNPHLTPTSPAGSPDPGIRTIIVMAVEGAFINDEVVNGDQVVFSRIRIRIDNLIEGEHYKVTYPYGVHEFISGDDGGPGVIKGPGESMTRDIGIVPGEFHHMLEGDIGPFLLPSSYMPGTDAFLIEGLTDTTVTGSPYGTNFYRIEGRDVGLNWPGYKCADITLGPDPLSLDDCVETDMFTVQGKIATNFGANIDRATYTKTSTDTQVNIWANAPTGSNIVATVDGGLANTMVESSPGSGNYYARIELGGLGAGIVPSEAVVSNLSDNPPVTTSRPIEDHLVLNVVENHVIGAPGTPPGLEMSVQSSNYVDPVTIKATMGTSNQVAQGLFSTLVVMADQGGGLAESTYLSSAGEDPATHVVFDSSNGGNAVSKVGVDTEETSGLPIDGVHAVITRGYNILTGGIVVDINGGNSIGPGALTYVWSHDNPIGSGVVIGSDLSQPNLTMTSPETLPVSYAGELVLNFTLTVTDATDVISTSNAATVQVVITEPATLPVDNCPIVRALYDSHKEKWEVAGSCNLTDNQDIRVYPGTVAGPDLTILIGEFWVEAGGLWDVSPGNGTADMGTTLAGETLSGACAYDKVWAISERGSIYSSDYALKRQDDIIC
ncbi:MAG: hypothetical protein ABGX83_01745 [Nitrospira sp.]|nr:hypothetical protein [Candidatus Manganitrophaceae bacterium]